VVHNISHTRAAIYTIFLCLGLLLYSSISLSEPEISSIELDDYLNGKASPIASNGPVFINSGLEWDIDPRLIIAIAGAESTFGKDICGAFNAWNWFWCHSRGTCGDNRCSNSPFDSWEQGIQTVSKYMRLSYLNKGYNTIPLIGSQYCASNCEHWEPNVTRFYKDELGGDISDLGFSTAEPPPTPGTFCVSTSMELAEALLTSENDGENNVIRLVQGIYKGNFVYNSREMHDLTLEGGYTAGCGSRVVDPSTTIFDGIVSGTVLNISSRQTINITVDNTTLQNGANGGISLCCNFSMITLTNNIIQENTSNNGVQGGGISICCDAVSITLNNNSISNNLTSDQGGGVFVCCNFETMSLDNNTVNNNTTNGQGGGIFVCCEANTLFLSNNTFSGNTTAGQGGGVNICCVFENIALNNNTISNNTTTDQGGGIFVCCDTVQVMINNNSISNNLTSDEGGGVFVCCGPITQVIFLSNTISHNMAGVGGSDEGGGIYVSGASATIINNVIYSNTATNQGGGVSVSDVTTTIMVNNTVQGNTSSNVGGGVFASLATGERIDIYNNIVWDNQAVQGADLYLNNDDDTDSVPATVNIFNNDFDQSAGGTFIQIPFLIDPSNLNNVDPLFVDASNDNYHLQVGSQVIDIGNNNAPNIPPTDRDGNPRIINGVVDMGAYEFTP
jgi:hypothetical protein